VLTHRESGPPLLAGQLVLDDFVEKLGSVLGAQWSRETLELVALTAEISPKCPDGPPIVDGTRLARAIEPGGFLAEFPQEYARCHLEARAAIEKTIEKTSRRTRPGSASKSPKVEQAFPSPPALETPITSVVDRSAEEYNTTANVIPHLPSENPVRSEVDRSNEEPSITANVIHQPSQASRPSSANRSKASSPIDANLPVETPIRSEDDKSIEQHSITANVVQQPSQSSRPSSANRSRVSSARGEDNIGSEEHGMTTNVSQQPSQSSRPSSANGSKDNPSARSMPPVPTAQSTPRETEGEYDDEDFDEDFDDDFEEEDVETEED
jgi:hypothetical protein